MGGCDTQHLPRPPRTPHRSRRICVDPRAAAGGTIYDAHLNSAESSAHAHAPFVRATPRTATCPISWRRRAAGRATTCPTFPPFAKCLAWKTWRRENPLSAPACASLTHRRSENTATTFRTQSAHVLKFFAAIWPACATYRICSSSCGPTTSTSTLLPTTTLNSKLRPVSIFLIPPQQTKRLLAAAPSMPRSTFAASSIATALSSTLTWLQVSALSLHASRSAYIVSGPTHGSVPTFACTAAPAPHFVSVTPTRRVNVAPLRRVGARGHARRLGL